jgi:hypothetical protein
MDDDLKRAIEDLHVVSSVRFHAGDKTHKSRRLFQPQVFCSVFSWTMRREVGGSHLQVDQISYAA